MWMTDRLCFQNKHRTVNIYDSRRQTQVHRPGAQGMNAKQWFATRADTLCWGGKKCEALRFSCDSEADCQRSQSEERDAAMINCVVVNHRGSNGTWGCQVTLIHGEKIIHPSKPVLTNTVTPQFGSSWRKISCIEKPGFYLKLWNRAGQSVAN